MFDYGGEVVDFDLLVTVPTNMGDECILVQVLEMI